MAEEKPTAARRSLHAVAERLLAGPEYRAVGGIALRVVPGGFATAEGPAIRVNGGELVVDEARRVPLVGTIADVAAAAEITEGPPEDLYHDHSDLGADPLQLDPTATAQLTDWYLLVDAALRAFAPGKTPVLWPEHFDVAIDLEDVTYGASPGDGFCAVPYAYVSTSHPGPESEYWNAPFGAYVEHTDLPTIDALVTFWKEGSQGLHDPASGAG
ncbi:MAG TPA: hypothetical protein VHI14_03220 [Jatrophihabitantaceae bacterium]|jgi:hypothetical protein|nr:hypothetical protein [Jatrophihabitantaceae bacterium]